MKREFIVWGTGDRSACFSENLEKMPVFYLDNDWSKKGTVFFERPVCHPSEIDDWSKYFIIIANSYYEEIKEQLLKLGRKENEDFLYYEKAENRTKRLEKLIAELKESQTRFEADYQKYKNSVLIFGSMISFDKNSYRLYNEAFQRQKDKSRFLLISEAYAIEERAKKGQIDFPFFCLPLMLWQNFHLGKNGLGEIAVDEKIASYIEAKEYCCLALADFKGKNEDMADGYAEHFIYHADLYLRRLFDFISPKKVFIWNQFYPFHMLISAICKEKKIDLLYMEYGVLPGTYLIERQGQMGESYPAVYAEEFQKLEVDDSDLEKAEKIYEYLHTSGINRKEQPFSQDLEKIKKKMKKGRPVIVYAGQNDYESGLYPYTENTKKYHSPAFTGSREAAVFLEEICRKNDWNFIYKPHPLCIGSEKDRGIKESDGSFFIEKCNINELLDWADVNITILSTVGYISLIRKKPVVMLGYTQLKDKGCTYQAFTKESVEEEIKRALAFGYTQKQEKEFIFHIARLVKYYLYDDMQDREIRFGKDWKRILAGEKVMF